jgi:hypothetical protein
VVSLCYYIKAGWPDSAFASMSLETFLEGNHRAARPNDQVRFVSGFAPEEAPSEALRCAKHNLKEEFTAFGLTERFDESLSLLRRQLGWTRLPVYVPSNVNRDRPTVEELWSTVESEYPAIERDLERFDRMNRDVDVVGPPALWVCRTGRSLFRRLTS